MDLKQILTEVGLEDHEARVYLATLELGESTVLPIAKKAGVKRTYCYDILADLGQKGLVSFFEKNGRRRYVAADPEKIADNLKNKLADFRALLPEFKTIENKLAGKPKVRFYEGKAGIMTVYEQFLSAKEMSAIASPNHIYRYLGDFFNDFSAKILAKKVRVRELATPDGASAAYLASFRKPLQEARILPKDIKLTTDMVIFDNKLALISYEGDLHAVVIESSSIVDTQKVLFDLIWERSS